MLEKSSNEDIESRLDTVEFKSKLESSSLNDESDNKELSEKSKPDVSDNAKLYPASCTCFSEPSSSFFLLFLLLLLFFGSLSLPLSSVDCVESSVSELPP